MSRDARFKGGRGHKAPYQTTHVRVPEPIKPMVERIVDDYKNDLPFLYISRDRMIELCHQIASQKKSARQSLNKLLTTLFDDYVDPSV